MDEKHDQFYRCQDSEHAYTTESGMNALVIGEMNQITINKTTIAAYAFVVKW